MYEGQVCGRGLVSPFKIDILREGADRTVGIIVHRRICPLEPLFKPYGGGFVVHRDYIGLYPDVAHHAVLYVEIDSGHRHGTGMAAGIEQGDGARRVVGHVGQGAVVVAVEDKVDPLEAAGQEEGLVLKGGLSVATAAVDRHHREMGLLLGLHPVYHLLGHFGDLPELHSAPEGGPEPVADIGVGKTYHGHLYLAAANYRVFVKIGFSGLSAVSRNGVGRQQRGR